MPQAPEGTLKVGGRLLRRVMGMYKDDAVVSNSAVLAQELSQRLFDADGELLVGHPVISRPMSVNSHNFACLSAAPPFRLPSRLVDTNGCFRCLVSI